jgi:hypothetical protein
MIVARYLIQYSDVSLHPISYADAGVRVPIPMTRRRIAMRCSLQSIGRLKYHIELYSETNLKTTSRRLERFAVALR